MASTVAADRRFLAAYYLVLGRSYDEVVQLTGYEKAYLYSMVSADIDFKQLMESIRGDVRTQVIDKGTDRVAQLGVEFDNLAVEAVDRLRNLLDSESERSQLGAINTILDQAPNAPKSQRSLQGQTHRLVIEAPHVTAAIQACREIGIHDLDLDLPESDASPIVDAEYKALPEPVPPSPFNITFV